MPPVRAIPAVSFKDPSLTGVVTVAQGQLRGVYNEDGSVEVYAGIPYAKPPVGDLRWREPQQPEPWQGVRVCDTFAPMSMQPRTNTIYGSLSDIVGFHTFRITTEDNFIPPMSEDSLYLNVWKPAGEVSGLEVYQVDVDENRDLAEAFRVFSIPTLVLMKNGKEVDRAVGLMPKEQLLKFVTR